jgi:protein-disulfide isomerase
MTDDQMNACLQDRSFAEALVAEYQKNAEADKIEATPTFFINGQREDNMTYEAFAAKLDAALGA